MEENLQLLANQFCNYYYLKSVKILFTTEFTTAELNLFAFLLAPEDKRTKTVLKIIEKAEMDARKDILWKELILNPRIRNFIPQFIDKEVELLGEAIKVCENKPIHSSGERLKEINEIAERIKKFHVEGKAIYEFRDLYRKIKKQPSGVMPLLVKDRGDLEKYIHEAIHFVLQGNGFHTENNPFWEGICTYMHKRWRGEVKTFSMYHGLGAPRHYNKWAKFFFEKFKNASPRIVGKLLRTNWRELESEYKQFNK